MSVIVPMRDIAVVEKVESGSSHVLPNAFLVSTKSKVGPPTTSTLRNTLVGS